MKREVAKPVRVFAYMSMTSFSERPCFGYQAPFRSLNIHIQSQTTTAPTLTHTSPTVSLYSQTHHSPLSTPHILPTNPKKWASSTPSTPASTASSPEPEPSPAAPSTPSELASPPRAAESATASPTSAPHGGTTPKIQGTTSWIVRRAVDRG